MAQRYEGKLLSVLGAMSAAVIVGAWFWFRAPPLTEELARHLAQEHLERYGQAVGLDVAKLGEARVIRAAEVPLRVEWLYSDKRGRVRVIIWVEESGWTEMAIDGPIERLYDHAIQNKPTKG